MERKGQDSALFGYVGGRFGVICFSSRGGPFSAKIAISDMWSGSFSGVIQGLRIRKGGVDMSQPFHDSKDSEKLGRLLLPTQMVIGPFVGCRILRCLLGLVFAVFHDMLCGFIFVFVSFLVVSLLYFNRTLLFTCF